jgi:hypothetical protein
MCLNNRHSGLAPLRRGPRPATRLGFRSGRLRRRMHGGEGGFGPSLPAGEEALQVG